MKRTLSALALGAVAFAAATASADSPTKAEAPKAREASFYDRLPKGKLDIPKTSTPPKSIPASEKVEGFYVEVPEHLKRMQDPYRYVQVYGSKEEAETRNRGGLPTGAPTCLTTAYPNMGSEVNWSGSLSMSTTVQNYARANYGYGIQYGSVQLVRSEKIVKETADKLTYEIKVAYVDAETQGVKLVSTQTAEYVLVKELPGKVKVWGMKSDDTLHFLVRRQRHDKERFFFGQLSVMVNGVHSMSSSEGCPITFTLKAGKGVAASAIVQIETVLEIKEAGADDEEKKGIVPSVHAQLPAFGQHEAKVRPLKIGLSSTWMSQDTKPVVTLAHGWAGRERTQPL